MRTRTIGELAERLYRKILENGELSESKVIQFFEYNGMTYWTWKKMRPDIMERLNSNHPEVKYNKKLRIFHISYIEDSLSTLSYSEKEESK